MIQSFFHRNVSWLKHCIPVFCMVMLCSCSETTTVSESECDFSNFTLPSGFPTLPIPPDNPIQSNAITLGRALFYDASLSKDGMVSCASCHKQEFAFSDAGKSVSRGVAGELGMRNSPAIINAAYQHSYFFDGRVSKLEDQILAALISPNELYSSHEIVLKAISSNPRYMSLLNKIYADDSITIERVVKAIATFTRTILTGNSHYDKFIQGKAQFNEQQKEGMKLFFGEKAGCAQCHSGFNFTDYSFASTGLYTHYYDKGRYYTTKSEHDIGIFKTPSLRNIAVTYPYMHDGAIASLMEVLEHYNKGGKDFVNKDKRIKPLNLTQAELQALEAFLKTLTDSSLITNSCYGKN